jgi:hypothetical protein
MMWERCVLNHCCVVMAKGSLMPRESGSHPAEQLKWNLPEKMKPTDPDIRHSKLREPSNTEPFQRQGGSATTLSVQNHVGFQALPWPTPTLAFSSLCPFSIFPSFNCSHTDLHTDPRMPDMGAHPRALTQPLLLPGLLSHWHPHGSLFHLLQVPAQMSPLHRPPWTPALCTRVQQLPLVYRGNIPRSPLNDWNHKQYQTPYILCFRYILGIHTYLR